MAFAFPKSIRHLACVVLACNNTSLFALHAVKEAAGLGILAGTSPLQHFFFGRVEGEGGRGCLMGASTCP